MGTFKPKRGLEQKVALMVARPLERIAEQVEREAKVLAPGTKEWVSKLDAKVRHTHRAPSGHGQVVPENLRFALDSMSWDITNRGVGPKTYMTAPRDQTGGAYINAGEGSQPLNNCRCTLRLDPQGVAKLISHEQPVISGKRVSVKVVCEGNLVVPAEFGTEYPAGVYGTATAPGARFMQTAAAMVAAQRRARR